MSSTGTLSGGNWQFGVFITMSVQPVKLFLQEMIFLTGGNKGKSDFLSCGVF